MPPSSEAPPPPLPYVRLGNDLGQAWFRLRFAVVYCFGYFIYTAFSGHGSDSAASASVITYLLFSVFWLLPSARSLLQGRKGRIGAILGDHGIISIGLFFLGDILAPAIWAPITVSIGNGLRYGAAYTKFSIAVASISVGTAMLVSPVWTAPHIVTLGIIFGIIVVPWYAISLSENVGRERRALVDRTTQLEEAAKKDSLTGVLNKAGFDEALAVMLRKQPLMSARCAVIVLDLDGFKDVNDQFGHQSGDELLKQIAKSLVRASRETALVARLGGDEFGILIPDAYSEEGLKKYAERLLDTVSTVSEAQASNQGVTASIGIFVAEKSDKSNARAVFQRADALMYAAKRAGKNRFRIATD